MIKNMELFFGEYGIMALILIILLLVMYLQKKYLKESSKKDIPEELPPVEELKPEPLLIHCPACGAEISRFAQSCFKCGHPIAPTNQALNNKTIINVQSEKKENRGGCLWSLLGLIVLIIAFIFFNFIGYFIALIILSLCRVFSAGDAIFLFIVGLLLTLLLPILGIISLGALFLS